jgi:hypothetical protein
MPTFSVVIPWRDRPELKQTIAANASVFERHGAEVLVVNCGGDPDEVSALLRDPPVSRVRQIYLPGASFNRSLAGNIGASCGTGRYAFFLDADITLVSDVLRQAQVKLEREPCFVHVRTVYESRPEEAPALAFLKEVVYTRRLAFKNGQVARLRTRQGGDGSGGGPGLIAANRDHLVAVGGFNAALVDWGYEDADLQIRLQVVLSLARRSAGEVLHLTHGNEKRSTTQENLRDGARRNEITCAGNYSRGLFQGTYLEDVRVWTPKLREIPVSKGLRVCHLHGSQ